jgi:hypothetical protein
MNSGQIVIIAITGVIALILFFVLGGGSILENIHVSPSTSQSSNPVYSANPETSMGTGAIGAGGISNSFIYEPVSESTYNLSYSPYTNLQYAQTSTLTYSPSITNQKGSGLFSLFSGNQGVNLGNASITNVSQGNSWRNELQAAQSINSQNLTGFQLFSKWLGYNK